MWGERVVKLVPECGGVGVAKRHTLHGVRPIWPLEQHIYHLEYIIHLIVVSESGAQAVECGRFRQRLVLQALADAVPAPGTQL